MRARLLVLIPRNEIEKLERYHYLCRKLKFDWRNNIPAGTQSAEWMETCWMMLRLNFPMRHAMINISWKHPWEAVLDGRVMRSLERELAREIGTKHPLWGREAKVIGRRVDNDDILVQLSDGSLARVHLGWPKTMDQILNTVELPWIEIYTTRAEFIARMLQDIEDYEA